jgi:hypothetical protein
MTLVKASRTKQSPNVAKPRLQLRFVPDKKADIEGARKSRRIPWFFHGVAKQTQF